MKTKGFLFAFIAAFVLPALAAANDGAVAGVSGNPYFIKGEHKSVRMVSEKVRMDVYPDYFTVAAEFVFRNEGKAVEVTMGFPENAFGDVIAEKSTFKWFKTWVDGKQVAAKRVMNEDGSSGPTAFWMKKVKFAAGQTRIVKVSYRGAGASSVEGDHGAIYEFTGGNWKGKLDKATFEAELHLKGASIIIASPELKKSGNRFFAEWKNWNGEGYVSIVNYITLPGAMLLDDKVKYTLNEIQISGDEAEKPLGKNFYVHEAAGTMGSRLPVYPAAILRDGKLMVRYDTLYRWLVEKEIAAECSEAIDYETSNIRQFKSAALGKCISFEAGKPDVLAEGVPVVRLAPAPFFKGDIGWGISEKIMYIPLDPVAKLLGLSCKSDAKNRRFKLNVAKKKS